MSVARTRGGAAAERAAWAKLQMLTATDNELINLDNATCSHEVDEAWIHSKIRGHEHGIAKLLAKQIRDVFCGVSRVRADATAAPGSLALSLVDVTIDLSALPSFHNPLLLLQFAGWLRLRPKVEVLTLRQALITARGVDLLQLAAHLLLV